MSETKQPNYMGRRRLLGISLAALALTHPVSEAVSKAVHIQNEINTFSEKHLGDHLDQAHIDPRSVRKYTIQPTDINPGRVAGYLGAIDTPAVASEISGQVGGQNRMQAGETVVLPNDQLRPPVASGHQ